MMDSYQEYIHKSRYARYLPEEKRRETWAETVGRYVGFWVERGQINTKQATKLTAAIEGLEVMPSMRAMMTAGEALKRDNVAGFNCAYAPFDTPRAFDELMYILLCGTGKGFSVEKHNTEKLPEVAEEFHPTDTIIHVADSKVGWTKAFRELLSLLWVGQVPQWDVSKVRPAGAALKTFGGRASGPGPLVDLFQFTVELFKGAAGRQLTTVECADIGCKVAQVVIVGGVRRSALIILCDLEDDGMRMYKHGNYPAHRNLANISAAYTRKPTMAQFLPEWKGLYESYSGERGIFSRVAAQKVAERNGRREAHKDFGTNPCSEIILRPNQFCNLSEVVVRPHDTLETLKGKVETATILGTLQATLTDFRYLRKVWQRNTEEEALLGVSLTGIMDHPVMSGTTKGIRGVDVLPSWLTELREVAVETNKQWSKKLGINQSAAITCVKPSGTVSQLVDSASGIHGRFAAYYVRRVRASLLDPLCEVLRTAGVPCEPDATNPNTLVFSFPQKAPKGSVIAGEQTGKEQLEIWQVYQDYWCEHKPSITVYYTDDQFLSIGEWVFNNFDKVSGVAFLPYDGGKYLQAPYEALTQEEYEEMLEGFPTEFDWDIIEHSDVTEASQTLACVGTSCELP